MTLTIELTPTEQEGVTAAARQKGLAPSEFIKNLLAEHVFTGKNGVSATPPETTVEEKIQAMDAVTANNRTLPLLPNEPSDRSRNGENVPRERDLELVARVRAIRGKYAHTAIGVGTEELQQERQRDREKEEALIRGCQP